MYRCADGPIMLVVGNNAQFGRLALAMGVPDLAEDHRFTNNLERVQNRIALNAVLEPVFASRPKQHWIDTFAAEGIPCGPVNELYEVFEDPQVQARGMVTHMPHPKRNRMPMLANPIRLSQTPVQYRHVPPALGQHTDEVLTELGYGEHARRALREKKVV